MVLPLAVDVFAVIMFALVGGLLAFLLALGAFYPGTGAEQLRWRPTRSPEVEAENEIDDLAQMLDAANDRRRARGKPERTMTDVEISVRAAQKDLAERQDKIAKERGDDDAEADDEIAELLALKNRRRARKGLAPLTREQYEASLETGT